MADDSTKLAICGALAKYPDSADLSDFTIVCEGSAWNAHRLVLSLHSRVLAKACDGDFEEAKDRKIDLSDHGVAHVKAFVHYLYTFNYMDGFGNSDASKMTFHVNMAIIADKYDIDGLKTLSNKKFKGMLSSVKSGDDLAEVAELAYGTADAVKEICQSIAQHIKDKDLLGSAMARKELEVMRKYPELAIDALKARTSTEPTECLFPVSAPQSFAPALPRSGSSRRGHRR